MESWVEKLKSAIYTYTTVQYVTKINGMKYWFTSLYKIFSMSNLPSVVHNEKIAYIWLSDLLH